MTSLLTREDMIEQSVTDFLRHELFTDRNLPPTEVLLQEAFLYENFSDQPLDKEYVTLGFNFDDGGRRGEIGSDLVIRTHTIEVWVFATEPERGRNLAGQVKAALEEDGFRVPLKDYRSDGDPVIDYLVLDDPGPRVSRQPHPNPQPWQRNAWTVTCKVIDEYMASQW